jgi:FSR family fosmidomycin resistance protein-like MFS transporter
MSAISEPLKTPNAPSTAKRDALVISLVSAAHFFSHFYQLALAPLFPLLHTAFDVSYVMLGSVVTAFYAVSGVCQTFSGILVDRWGARPVLIGGIALMAVCILLAGLVSDFWMLYPLLIVAGLGNSIFHPADFSALSHYVSNERHGRAFSIHSFAGSAGYAASPLITGAIAVAFGWRAGLITAGVMGILMTLLLLRYAKRFMPDFHETHHDETLPKFSYLKIITMPVIILSFSYLLFSSMATGALQSFATTSFIDFYSAPLTVAATALSTYLICSALGMLIGGIIADRTERHARVAFTGLGLAAVFVSVIASGMLPFGLVAFAMALVGLSQGVTAPSRDILVKSSAPKGSIGRVFGIVYSGGDAALSLAPVVFGALADHHAYHAMFFGIAALYVAGMLTVTTIGQRKAEAAI